jgi:hypothetical protein
MANAAVVKNDNNLIINKIVADAATDLAPDGTYLVNIPDGSMCEMGWFWDGTNFVNPNPPVEILVEDV